MADGLASRAWRRAGQAAAAVAAGSANALARLGAGVGLELVTRVSPAPQGVGVAVSQAPARLLASVVAGVAASPVVSAVAQAAHGAGVGLGAVSDVQRLPARPGARVTLASHQLSHLSGATSGASSGTAWSSPGNAVGTHNGTLATLAGSATAAVDGTFTLSYAAQPSRGDLVLGQTQLLFWLKLAGAVLGVTVTADYSLDGGSTWTNVVSWTADTDATATPVTVPLSPTWAQLSQLKTRVRFVAPAVTGATATASLDAVELSLSAARPADS